MMFLDKGTGAAVAGILTRELDSLSHFLHGQVPYCTETASTTGAALHPLLACVADEVATLTLVDGRENIVQSYYLTQVEKNCYSMNPQHLSFLELLDTFLCSILLHPDCHSLTFTWLCFAYQL